MRPENQDSRGGYSFLPQKLNNSQVKIQSILSLWVLGTYRPVHLTLQESHWDFEIETLFLNGYLNICPPSGLTKRLLQSYLWHTVCHYGPQQTRLIPWEGYVQNPRFSEWWKNNLIRFSKSSEWKWEDKNWNLVKLINSSK